VISFEATGVRRGIAATLVLLAVVTAGSARTEASASGDEPSSPVPVFVLDKGRFEAFDPPGVGAQDFVDINNRGRIAGGYKESFDPTSDQHGFLRDRRGKFATMDFPGAAVTSLIHLNNRGQVVGLYSNNPDGTRARGFVRDERGRFRTIRVPGAVYTQAFGINDRGRVVGDYLGADGIIHGFAWRRGRFTSIDGPEGSPATLTDINDRGDIIGVYPDPTQPGALAGFLLRNGRYTTFAVPGATFTLPVGLNDRGQIVGLTAEAVPGADVPYHGFVLRRGAKGPFTQIDFPGAPSTLATGIDDHGRIVGIYSNPNAPPSAQRDAAAEATQALSDLARLGVGGPAPASAEPRAGAPAANEPAEVVLRGYLLDRRKGRFATIEPPDAISTKPG
jgi:hypothetical protein